MGRKCLFIEFPLIMKIKLKLISFSNANNSKENREDEANGNYRSCFYRGHPERIAVVSTGRTMARKCVKRKRYPATSEPPSKSSFLTRSTGKSSNHGQKGGARPRIG
ncbi:uncharacterized protein LOC116186035 [Apis dorsata]|uniref:uncharacterized protein LOC116186035 n=1 Tax=Apis dorsata TaxID=7462 RepID=UPI0012937CCC|nr:uncharacterized protein LOC116186035 [Apis dorsata]